MSVLDEQSRVAQRKRAGPITQRSVDRNYALLYLYSSLQNFQSRTTTNHHKRENEIPIWLIFLNKFLLRCPNSFNRSVRSLLGKRVKSTQQYSNITITLHTFVYLNAALPFENEFAQGESQHGRDIRRKTRIQRKLMSF